jgi:hypothetical protein
MPERLPKGITQDDMAKLRREHPNRDPLPGHLGMKTHVGGTIEEIEERRFPWLRARRARRRATQNPE